MSTLSRTQSERRAATVDALLTATIQVLIDGGYAALTTRRVAERAGVSQGAQQHYFPTKNALVDAALHRMVEELAAEAVATPLVAETERDRAAELLDRLWDLHNLPICPAVIELLNAARTDTELAEQVVPSTRAGMAAIQSIAAVSLPTYAAVPGFADFIAVAVSTVRGSSTLIAIPGLGDLHPPWPRVRAMLMQVLDGLLG
ncbi:TetR/AcrR family transcriptional regulator [Nocardia thailandica]|uniref:TetR/AcrR family transcriptional regulator n=1 Tax=Nocardia thailandica TaxID=257275 RepID=A0ABW6PIX0_9NOCA|nr:TetR/AcrR family transcriptional regulator [Nocardia thailandica]